MSGTLTDTTDRAILNWITGTSLGGWTPPSTSYIALLTADPSTTATIPTDPQLTELTELVATGYSRQVATFATATSTGGATQNSNSNLITFGPFTAVGGSGTTTTFGALVNVASGTSGEVICVWQWDNNGLLAAQNQSLTIPIGNLVMTQQ
jgi:hypothetical protein